MDELLRRGGKAGNVGRAINPYHGESLGDLWHGHVPDWYAEAKAELDERLGRISPKTASSTKLKAVMKQREELQQRIDKLEQELSNAQQNLERRWETPDGGNLTEELTKLRKTVDKLEMEKESLSVELSRQTKVEADTRRKAEAELNAVRTELVNLTDTRGVIEQELDAVKRRESLAHQRQQQALEESHAAKEQALEIQNALDQTQQKLEDANRRLAYLKPIQFSDLKELFSLRFLTLSFAWSFMFIAVVIAILAISEIQKRQQFIQIVASRIEEVQQELVSQSSLPSGPQEAKQNPVLDEFKAASQLPAETDLTDRLRKLHRIKTDVHLLVATGATSPQQKLEGIRDRLLKLDPLASEDSAAEQRPRERTGWFYWIEDLVLAVSDSATILLALLERWSSDLLLSLIVILAGSIGAVVAAMRAGVLFTFRELGLGLAAGLITFLVIRSGRSIFILQADGAMFVLNPYTSAFFGMAAGIFTDRAYRLLMAVISKLISKVQEAFELDPSFFEDSTRPHKEVPDADQHDSKENSPEAPAPESD